MTTKEIITYNGFYDSLLEWIGIENIQIICSVTTGDTLNSRFISNNKIIHFAVPEKSDLKSIFSIYLQKVIKDTSAVSALAGTMVDSYWEIKNNFNQIQYSHYLFSPRDLALWSKNLLRYQLQELPSIIEALFYEGERLFKDKLAVDTDKDKYDEIIRDNFTIKFNDFIRKINLNEICFVKGENDKLQRISKNEWEKYIQRAMAQIDGDMSEGRFVAKELSYLSAVAEHALSQPGAGLMLIGKQGLGRKSALRLVANRLNAIVFSPKISKSYTVTNFKKDIKTIIQQATVDNEQVYILLEDYQIVHINCLGLMNTLISTGDVSGIFGREEFDNIKEVIIESMQGTGFTGTPMEYIKHKVQQNIHAVFVLDCNHTHFLPQCQTSPELMKTSFVCWISKFSEETMRTLPRIMFQKIEEQSLQSDSWSEFKNTIISSSSKMHSVASKFVDVSPFRYCKFLDTFITIYEDKKRITNERKKNLEAGVSKIMEVRNTVDNLEKQASERKSLLAEKQSKSNEVLDKISATMAYANTRREELEARRQKAQTENDALQIRKNEINQELSKIEPLIQEARAAVGNIKPEALSEIRSLRVPPDIVRDILEGVLRLMGIRDTSWYSMRTFLASRGVKEDIRCFDATQITNENRKSVEELLEKQKHSFDPSNAKRASAAAAPLAAWVIANVQYSKVLENIRPLEEELEKIQRNLKMYTIQINELGLGLKTADDTVEKLKNQLSVTSRDVAEIEIHIKKAEGTIQAARGLVNKLDDEFSIWKKQLLELSTSAKTLPFNCLIASAFINYCGRAAEDLRNSVMKDWLKILNSSEDFSLTELFCSESELLQWTSEGLPSDQLSRENALIIKNISYHALLTDPSNVSIIWLTTHFKERSIEVTTYSNPRFYNQLELSIRFGKILVIQDVNGINPSLMPILRKDLIHQGSRKLIHIGEKIVDYNDDFKLILISRSSFPAITPDMIATLAIVNFTSTKEGLRQQLLRSVIKIEKPALEENRIKLMQEVDSLKYKLHNLQEKVLKELACAEGDILENKDLLLSLEDTKRSSSAIWQSLEESSQIQNELDKQCHNYKSFASYASTLYFACSSLKYANNMYSISLKAFLRLFGTSVSQSKTLESMDEKCQSLLEIVHNYISRSLYKTDRLMFSLHLLHKVYPNKIPSNEWELFLGKSVSEHKSDSFHGEFPKWIDKSRITDVINFQALFPDLYKQLQLGKEELWENFMKEKNPNITHCSVTEFQIILIVQLLRPERLYSYLNNFCLKTLSLQSLSPKNTSLNDLFMESLPDEPILLIISPGVDPSEELSALARSKNIKCTEISLGEIEINDMTSQLVTAAKSGTWLIMKNLHLMTSWISILEKEFKSVSFYHEHFRLWLTTEQHDNFSSLLLNMCLKVTYEAPQGIKHNMERTYNMWLINNDMSKTEEVGKTLLALAWFHAVLQERRTYIPQGWANYYEFNDADFSAALHMIKNVVKSSYDNDLRFKYIQGLCDEAIYGGRINNIYDQHVLSAYLKTIFNKNIFNSGSNSYPLAPGLHLPSINGREDLFKFIKKLPENDQPSYFGLPDNINNAWQEAKSLSIINQLKDLDNEETTALYLNGKEWSHQLSLFLKIWKKIHKDANLPLAVNQDNQNYADPIKSFLILELTFASELIRKIHHCLVVISKVLKGVTLPSISVSQAMDSLIKQKTPDEWLQTWLGPKTPIKYIRAVISRAIAIHRLQNEPDLIDNKPVDVTELFNSDSFFSAVQLHKAKQADATYNDLKLTIAKKGKSDANSFLINGLLLEGAVIQDGALVSCESDSPSEFNCSAISLAFEKMIGSDLNESVGIPIYTSSAREQVVTEINMPIGNNNKLTWIKSGLAFFIKEL